MCTGTPMRVFATDGLLALCIGAHDAESPAVETVDLALVGELAPGTEVLVHLGVAMRVIDASEAAAIRDALAAVRLAQAGLPFEHLLADLIDREPQLPAHLIDAHNEQSAREQEERHERIGGHRTT